MTQGKIERYHRTMKNLINLQHYYMPWELEHEIEQFVEYYNNQRYHESLNNLTPADVYYGRSKEILSRRNKIKKQTLKMRKFENLSFEKKEMVLTWKPEKYLLALYSNGPKGSDDIHSKDEYICFIIHIWNWDEGFKSNLRQDYNCAKVNYRELFEHYAIALDLWLNAEDNAPMPVEKEDGW